MYYDFTVPVPKVQGKIIRKPKGDTVYVCIQRSKKERRPPVRGNCAAAGGNINRPK